MFFRGRMNLRREDAMQRCRALIANARRFGGTLVVNWHDRSLAPERLWDEAYRTLLNEIATGDRAWFATAGEAVEWFRWRRSVRFFGDNGLGVTVASPTKVTTLPPVVIRVNRPGDAAAEELAFNGAEAVRVGL
jgi:hypothetical protein